MYTDGILFDLDGTLWDAVTEITVAWNNALKKHPELREPFTEAELRGLMGLPMNEIADRIFSAQPLKRRMELLKECMQVENDFLKDHGARLYPDVPETLRELHKEHSIYIVSNCQCGYIEAFLHAHHLEPLVDGFLCFGDTFASKGENIKTVVRKYGLQAPVYIGDTQGDQKAATYADVPFIFADYGFGHVEQYDQKIDKFQDLLSLLTGKYIERL